MVYKLVAVADDADPAAPMRPVAKASTGKVSVGGRKTTFRALDDAGRASREVAVEDGADPPSEGRWRALQVPVFRDGAVVHRPDLADVRRHHRSARDELAPAALEIADGEAAMTVESAAREGAG